MMVLSKESEEFIANLRLYLMTSGKKDKEINDIAEELSDHLKEAESRGKTVADVTGGSPESYLKGIRQEMATDYLGILKMMPMFLLLLMAYMITGPAIRGDLSFSLLSLIAYPLVCVLFLIVYTFAFRKMSSKNWSTKKILLIFGGLQLVIVSIFLGVLFLDLMVLDPFYVPSREVMWVIAGAGAAVFIASVFWSKAWVTLFIPLFLFGPDFVMTFMDVNETTGLYVNMAAFVVGFILLMAYLLIQNKKQNPHKS